ncbi:MAG TPA: hypothetical protein VG675_18765 [Bryobacteraceae bacterium]|nr:hypothetical protein [Bryobacteraceae bacterium]
MKCIVLLAIAVAAWGQERLTIGPLGVPVGPNDRASCVSLSEDGALVVFQLRRTDGHGGADLWFSQKRNGQWSAPYNPGPGINTAANEVDGKLSPDGKTLVFIRGADFKQSSAIYISRFRDGQWATAEPVGEPVNMPGTLQFGALLTSNGQRLYFSSNRSGGLGGLDVYYSDRKGDGWGAPVNLGAPINTPGDDGDISLNRDGTTIVFPARGLENSFGGVDLYISRRGENGWMPPVNLGPRINTAGNDSCPWLGYDGRTLYFNSDWDGLVAGHPGKSSVILQLRYTPGF